MQRVKIFRYLDDLDCFVVSDEYRAIADQLGLTEWSPVVWIGRLFSFDNDYGEHWFGTQIPSSPSGRSRRR